MPVGKHLCGILGIGLLNRTSRWCVGLKVNYSEGLFSCTDEVDISAQDLTALPSCGDGILNLQMGPDWACEALLLQSLDRTTHIPDGLVKVLFETESFCRMSNRLLWRDAT